MVGYYDDETKKKRLRSKATKRDSEVAQKRRSEGPSVFPSGRKHQQMGWYHLWSVLGNHVGRTVRMGPEQVNRTRYKDELPSFGYKVGG